MYHLLVNRAAGESEIIEGDEGERLDHGHFNTIGVYNTPEEAEQGKADYAGKPKYAVFYSRPMNSGYVCKVDNLSGNYKGTGHHPYSFIDEHATEEEADRSLAEMYK